MRGTRLPHSASAFRVRFIPAHAGNTNLGCPTITAVTVHPRACGEHLHKPQCRSMADGSSPRMRGTRRAGIRHSERGRFIPAHAGNTRTSSCARPRRPVHPRACGEHASAATVTDRSVGSSPRMRGTRRDRDADQTSWRFIPAHAGNTRARCTILPPRRFIPAHAGNTLAASDSLAESPVHPRACGEHVTAHSQGSVGDGSSPRMRGTRSERFALLPPDRFIPAHAGNTWSRRHHTRCRAVHPRACGEHVARILRASDYDGSSPRMRGTPVTGIHTVA